MRELRKQLWAKLAAIVLLVLLTAGAAVCVLATILTWSGYGTGPSFYEDDMCQDAMSGAMYNALYLVTEPDSPSWSRYQWKQEERYAGFGYQVYDGDPDGGVLLGADSVPESCVLRQELVVEYDADPPESPPAVDGGTGTETGETSAPDTSAESGEPAAAAGYYTVVGYLPGLEELPRYSYFYQMSLIDRLVRPLDGVAPLFAVILALLATADLGFLLYAAGHRRDQEGVVANWQDRIPFDLYLCGMTVLFCAIIAIGQSAIEVFRYQGSSSYFPAAAALILCALAAGLVVLAALMTLATRLKLGKWWRNTLCYKLIRWCWRMCKRVCSAIRDFIRILPFTWRTVLVVGGVLFAQIILTLLMFESYNGGFFFLLNLVFDGALIVAAAWLSMQLQQVKDMGKALAAGDLEAKLDTRKLFWDVRTHAESLNAIGVGMNKAVEQRMKSERLKTELITNVSHDIKTPLTSIVNYVDLLKKEELPETASEYVAVLDRQSHRLKKLTEDLVEASKASTGNVAVKLEPIVVNEIIHQAIGDYDEKLSAGRLEVIVNTYEGNLNAMADGRLLWRVLDNLLSNVCKYALAGTRVYVDLGSQDGLVHLSMKNISRDPLNVNPDELMERFVRGDASRHTEGSGLGLNIAMSLMELMGGTFAISVDGDLFKAELTLRSAP